MTKTGTDKEKPAEKYEHIFSRIMRHIPNSNIWNAVATIALVIVGITGVYITQKALRLSERAWLTPIGGQVFGQLENGKPLHFRINFINSGRQSAMNTNFQIQNSIIDGYKPDSTDLYNISVPQNTSCDNLIPQSGHPIFPPTPSGAVISENFNTISAQPPLEIDERIINGDKFYVVRGCVAYSTYEEPHSTGFCYILESTPVTITIKTPPPEAPLPSPVPNASPSGTSVPPSSPPTIVNGRKLVFVTCPTGFSAN